MTQMVKRLPAMWETRVQSLGWEDSLEKEMATQSSTLAWKIPWTEEPGRLQSKGSKSRTRLSDFTFFTLYIQGQENSSAQPGVGADDGGMISTQRERNSSLPPHFSFDYKTVAQ